MGRYIKELHKIMTNTTPAAPTSLSRAEIEAAIASITLELRGPLPNVERLNLVEDRHVLRKQLAALD